MTRPATPPSRVSEVHSLPSGKIHVTFTASTIEGVSTVVPIVTCVRVSFPTLNNVSSDHSTATESYFCATIDFA
ncbi:hypothetical protein ES708_18097 [subsurface metagenome]